ncbi:hypothetical protein EMIT07CA2_160087 [Brevibacillus sp. IT-7CA2]
MYNSRALLGSTVLFFISKSSEHLVEAIKRAAWSTLSLSTRRRVLWVADED